MCENESNNEYSSLDNVDVATLYNIMSDLHSRGLVSSKTFLGAFSIDYEEEISQIKQEHELLKKMGLVK